MKGKDIFQNATVKLLSAALKTHEIKRETVKDSSPHSVSQHKQHGSSAYYVEMAGTRVIEAFVEQTNMSNGNSYFYDRLYIDGQPFHLDGIEDKALYQMVENHYYEQESAKSNQKQAGTFSSQYKILEELSGGRS